MYETEHVEGQLVTLPEYDELTFVSHDDDIFIERNGGTVLATYLRDLGLEMWQDASENYWIGMADQNVHEHDRWHYMITAIATRMTSGWDITPFRALTGCTGEYVASGTTDILAEIRELNGRLSATCALMKVAAGIDRARTIRKLLVIHRIFKELSVRGMIIAAKGRWEPETHDLLRHFNQWQSAQGLQDMPVDLILRSHGLAWFAEDQYLN